MKIGICDSWPEDLTPITRTRKCGKCGNYTWWASPRQKIHGRCWDCIPGLSFRETTPAHYDRCLDLLLRAFPGATVSEEKPRRYRPGTYRGPDVGPCRRCGGAIRLYGPRAHPLCLDCDERKESS